MRKKQKIWLVVAAFLVTVGLLIFVGVMSFLDWNFLKLSTVKNETNTYDFSEKINDILIDTNTADIEFLVSDSEKCRVTCYEEKNEKHSVNLTDGALVIDTLKNRRWYEYIGFNFNSPKITIYIPQGKYQKLNIKSSAGDINIPKDFEFNSVDILTSTGDTTILSSSDEHICIKASTGKIEIKNISADSIDLSVSTGKVCVSGVRCKNDISVDVSTGKTFLSNVSGKNLFSDGDTGDISLENVILSDKIYIERDTGDVGFDSCDSAEIFVETDTGDVKGNLLSDKVFITQTDTGFIDVPKTIFGGKCEIITDTGDIKIKVNK